MFVTQTKLSGLKMYFWGEIRFLRSNKCLFCSKRRFVQRIKIYCSLNQWRASLEPLSGFHILTLTIFDFQPNYLFVFFCLIQINFSNQRSFYHGGQHFEAFPGESANMIDSSLLAESEKTIWVYGEDAPLPTWHSFLFMCKQNCPSLDWYLPFHSFTSNSENKPEQAMQTQSNTTYQHRIVALLLNNGQINTV